MAGDSDLPWGDCLERPDVGWFRVAPFSFVCFSWGQYIYIYIYTWDIHEMYVVVISMNYNMELQSDVSARAPSFLE